MPDPLLDNEIVTTLGRAALGGEPGAVVYADRRLRSPGTVAVGPETVQTDLPALLAFRDEMPGANWMHPCTYALVSVETGVVLSTIASDRPPVFGHLPDTWVVVSDPGGMADLVPPA